MPWHEEYIKSGAENSVFPLTQKSMCKTSPDKIQGAAPESAHITLDWVMPLVQQSPALRKGQPTLEHPLPPQIPQAALQHVLPDWMPGIPPSHSIAPEK